MAKHVNTHKENLEENLFSKAEYIISAYSMSQLPETGLPEVAFAGRSNVGKSSLINRLLSRKNLVKVSSKPGKTQSLNYFLVDESRYFVDLPGYGFAKVPQQMKKQWQALITSYLENRQTLRCVVVIIDLRHEAKKLDLDLVSWLRGQRIPVLIVYTKSDKLSGNKAHKHAKILDASFLVSPADRVMFSAKTGSGRENLANRINQFIEGVE